MLVDDHGLFREGTTLLLKSIDPSIEVDSARSAQECLRKASEGGIDLVFLDLGLPDKPGLDALSELKAAYPELPVVVLSGHEDRATVLESIKRGAMGFIPKSSDDPKLLWHALKMATAGVITVPSSIARGEDRTGAPGHEISSSVVDSSKKNGDLGLTARQWEVLRLLLQGMPNKSIARRMEIAETTARGYVSDLLAAFRVANRTQLVLEVARRGINTSEPLRSA